MPSWIEFRLGCQGLYRLASLNRAFLSYFDRSTAGAVRSFGLALPLLPLYLWLVWLNTDRTVPDVGFYLTAKTVGYAYSWILFPFVIIAAAQLLHRNQEAAGCITVYNWTSVLWMVLQVPISLMAASAIAPDMAKTLYVVLFVANLVIEGFLFIATLRVLLWQAAALVAIDFVLTQAVIWPVSEWLGGGASTG
jgi:hypothetical protein